MSKRKSRAKSMFVDQSDMVFEDDSDPDVGFKIDKDNGSVRISSRAKKQKNIYDPSEYNGPVHKKKKEAMETALILAVHKKMPQQLSSPKAKDPPKVTKTPVKTPAKPAAHPIKSPHVEKTPANIKKKLVLEKQEIPGILKATKVDIPKAPAQATVQKVESKRQTRNKSVPPEDKSIDKVDVKRDRSASTSGNSEFEKASTVEMKSNDKIPDVKKWSAEEVYSYFIKQNFDKKDVLKLKEQDIDGLALLLITREDLKDLNMKVGTFVKMWNRILTFQTGKNDFTQGWK